MSTKAYTRPMLPPGTFEGRTIVVTGGGTGLGRQWGNTCNSLAPIWLSAAGART